jgi:hypothetical protein
LRKRQDLKTEETDLEELGNPIYMDFEIMVGQLQKFKMTQAREKRNAYAWVGANAKAELVKRRKMMK